MRAKAERDVQSILQELNGRPAQSGSIEKKITDFYAAYLDGKTIEAAALQPVRSDLDSIAAAQTHEDIARLMSRPDISVNGPYSIDIWADDKNPDRYILNISPAGLSLPDRDYYVKDDPALIHPQMLR